MIIELKIGPQSLKVDKELLSRYSDYFDAMFSSPFSEQSSDTITLKHIHFKSVKVIVDYIYSGKLVLNPYNIEDVFLTADFLQISTVRQRCLELFEKNLAPNNCINIHKLSVQHGLKKTEKSAVKTIMKCFEQIYEDHEYLDFTGNLLFALLSDCDLNISDEMNAFNAIDRWIHHDPLTRKLYKDELLRCVMVELLTNQDLHKVITSDLVKNSSAVKQHYKELLSSNDVTGKRRNLKGGKGLGKERLGMISGRVYIIGGLTNKKTPGDVEVFIPSYKEQQRDCNTYIRRSFTQKLSADDVITQSDDVTKMEYCSKYVTQSYGGSAAVIDGQVYVVGGRIDGDISDRLYKVELHTQSYIQLGKVPVWCDHATVTCSDKKLFVIGGYQLSDSGSTKFPSDLVQIYNTSSGEWETGPKLNTPRAHAASIGIDSGGGLASRVLVLGGYGKNKLNTVELITDGKTVEVMPPMIKPRHAFCAAMVNGAIIVVGGWNERSVEKYDFRNKQWSLLNNFLKHRDCIQGTVCEEVLYVFGGVKKNEYVPTIEKYDPEKDSWKTVGQFIVPRLYSAVAVT
ncbi:hypothetical protein ACHWQZ_G018679 [Mnemiopsis leidyi]